MLRFSDPRAVQALDAAIVKLGAAGKLADKNRWTWAYAIGLPFPASDSAMNLATQVFDARVRWGDAPAFYTAATTADAIFATLKPGWLGSILGAIAEPAVIAIGSAVTLGAVGAVAGAGSAALGVAKDVLGNPLDTFANAFSAPKIALPQLTAPSYVIPPAVETVAPAPDDRTPWYIAGGLLLLALVGNK